MHLLLRFKYLPAGTGILVRTVRVCSYLCHSCAYACRREGQAPHGVCVAGPACQCHREGSRSSHCSRHAPQAVCRPVYASEGDTRARAKPLCAALQVRAGSCPLLLTMTYGIFACVYALCCLVIKRLNCGGAPRMQAEMSRPANMNLAPQTWQCLQPAVTEARRIDLFSDPATGPCI